MSARVAITGVLLVFMMAFTVFLVEMLVPLSVYSDFNDLCRIALVRMEVNGGMSDEIEEDLYLGISGLNLTEIRITGAQNVKYGDYLRLQVSAALETNELISLFQRGVRYKYISYDKTSVSRRVVK